MCQFCLLVQTTSVTPWQTTSVTVLTVRCPRWMGWQMWLWWRLSCKGQALTGPGTRHRSRCMGPHLVLLSLDNSTVMLLGKDLLPGHSWDPHVLRCSQVSGRVVKGATECLTLEELHMEPWWWTGWAPLMHSKQRNQRWQGTGPGRRELVMHV